MLATMTLYLVCGRVMRSIAVIPAKGRSVSLPGKNKKVLAGKPLYQWSILSAQEAGIVPIVSSDDPEILDGAVSMGALVCNRPVALVGDGIHSVEVVLQVLGAAKVPNDAEVFMFLPTAPMRGLSHITQARGLLENGSVVVGVTEVCPVNRLRIVAQDGINIRPLYQGGRSLVHAQRQQVPMAYKVNGALFLATAATLREHGTYHVTNCKPLVMPWAASVDIDTIDDFHMAEMLMEAKVELSAGKG